MPDIPEHDLIARSLAHGDEHASKVIAASVKSLTEKRQRELAQAEAERDAYEGPMMPDIFDRPVRSGGILGDAMGPPPDHEGPKAEPGPAQFALPGSFTEMAHPRHKAGSEGGGQFKSKVQGDVPLSEDPAALAAAIAQAEKAEQKGQEQAEAKEQVLAHPPLTPESQVSMAPPSGAGALQRPSRDPLHQTPISSSKNVQRINDMLLAQSPWQDIVDALAQSGGRIGNPELYELFNAVETYASNTQAYKRINGVLHDCPDPPYDCATPEERVMIDTIRKIIHSAEPLPPNIVVLRGAREKGKFNIEGFRRAMEQGKLVSLTGFVSTSVDELVADGFNEGMFFRIRAKNGLYIGGGEFELIQDHLSVYRVLSVEGDVIDLEEVDRPIGGQVVSRREAVRFRRPGHA